MTDVGAAGKPAVDALGIDVASLAWRRPGRVNAVSSGVGAPAVADAGPTGPGLTGPGLTGPPDPAVPPGAAIEVAVVPRADGQSWVLVRVTDDPAGRILVYDQHEWECFLDGVRKGEFDQG